MKVFAMIIGAFICTSQAQAGYQLSKDEMSMFSQGRVSAAHHVDRSRAISAIKYALFTRGQWSTELATSEANSIFDSADVVGIDPLFLATMLRENYLSELKISRNTERYPISTPVVRELQDQYGNTRKGLSAEGMSSLMRDQLRRRFGNSAQAHEFMRALSQPTNSARITIRNNPNYAIFSVAQFLKLLLAKDALIHFDTPAVSYASYAYYGEGVPPCIRVNVAANKRKEMLNIMRELSSLDKALTCSGLNQLKRLYGIALQ